MNTDTHFIAAYVTCFGCGALEKAKTQRSSRSLEVFRHFLGRIQLLPFDEQAARHYGRIRADLERGGQLIGGNDLLIAATALAHGLTVVTKDIAEFQRVHGLTIEDWSS